MTIKTYGSFWETDHWLPISSSFNPLVENGMRKSSSSISSQPMYFNGINSSLKPSSSISSTGKYC